MAKKILIIDDEAEITALVKSRLESNRFVVVVASDGEEGLEKVKSEKPDLVIADISMPKVDGYTFAIEVRKLEEFRSLPIIILTAKEHMKELFKIEGINDYVVKPFDSDEMIATINKYISE